MELTTRIKNFTFLILGVIFLITGFALNELDILQINMNNVDVWYEFIAPLVGNAEQSGLPVPWG